MAAMQEYYALYPRNPSDDAHKKVWTLDHGLFHATGTVAVVLAEIHSVLPLIFPDEAPELIAALTQKVWREVTPQQTYVALTVQKKHSHNGTKRAGAGNASAAPARRAEIIAVRSVHGRVRFKVQLAIAEKMDERTVHRALLNRLRYYEGVIMQMLATTDHAGSKAMVSSHLSKERWWLDQFYAIPQQLKHSVRKTNPPLPPKPEYAALGSVATLAMAGAAGLHAQLHRLAQQSHQLPPRQRQALAPLIAGLQHELNRLHPHHAPAHAAAADKQRPIAAAPEKPLLQGTPPSPPAPYAHPTPFKAPALPPIQRDPGKAEAARPGERYFGIKVPPLVKATPKALLLSAHPSQVRLPPRLSIPVQKLALLREMTPKETKPKATLATAHPTQTRPPTPAKPGVAMHAPETHPAAHQAAHSAAPPRSAPHPERGGEHAELRQEKKETPKENHKEVRHEAMHTEAHQETHKEVRHEGAHEAMHEESHTEAHHELGHEEKKSYAESTPHQEPHPSAEHGHAEATEAHDRAELHQHPPEQHPPEPHAPAQHETAHAHEPSHAPEAGQESKREGSAEGVHDLPKPPQPGEASSHAEVPVGRTETVAEKGADAPHHPMPMAEAADLAAAAYAHPPERPADPNVMPPNVTPHPPSLEKLQENLAAQRQELRERMRGQDLKTVREDPVFRKLAKEANQTRQHIIGLKSAHNNTGVKSATAEAMPSHHKLPEPEPQ